MKTPLKITGILCGVGFTVIAGAAAAQPATFMIVNYGSGLCLEPNGSGLGAPILQQPCDSTHKAQHWVPAPPPLPSIRSRIKDSPRAWTCGTLEMPTGPSSSSGAAIYRP